MIIMTLIYYEITTSAKTVSSQIFPITAINK